jgi:hypothetical protein
LTIAVQAPQYFTVGPVPSGSACIYTGVLTQRDGETPIASGMLLTLTLTLVDEVTRSVINSRDAQNVLNANGVTVDVTGGTGVLTWILSNSDNVFVRDAPPPAYGEIERHEAVFAWTWQENSVTYEGERKVFILVESYQNLDKPSMGSGSVVVTDFVYQDDGITPVDDALVWVTSDTAGDTFVAGPVPTTLLGQYTFLLNPGTYYVWVKSPSFALSGPNALTVT